MADQRPEVDAAVLKVLIAAAPAPLVRAQIFAALPAAGFTAGRVEKAFERLASEGMINIERTHPRRYEFSASLLALRGGTVQRPMPSGEVLLPWAWCLRYLLGL